MILYRPVGLAELKLIAQSDYHTFPPRLPEQPIFYPVLNQQYAEQIARDWNSTSAPFAGFVTRFEIDDAYVSRFPVQTVGNTTHQELWIPAEELQSFNRHIHSKIEIIRAFYGEKFTGMIDQTTQLPTELIP